MLLRKLLVAGAAAALCAPGAHAQKEHTLKATKDTVHWCASAPSSPSGHGC